MDWKKLEQENCEKCTKKLDCMLLAKGICPMSYIRMGHPLTWFKDNSHSYVYLSESGIQDYDDAYSDNATLVEIIGIIIARETGDSDFATKIVRLLAQRLNIMDQLRENPLTPEQYIDMLFKGSGSQ
jgi:hypothetical protein